MVATAPLPSPTRPPVSSRPPVPLVPLAPAPGIERRGAERFPILQRCLVRPAAAAGAADWHAIAYNVSVTGIGLALPCQLAPGTVLLIQPWGLEPALALRA